jgi:hypothetical protein
VLLFGNRSLRSRLSKRGPSRNLAFAFTAYSTYAEWKTGSRWFESMSAYAPVSASLTIGYEPERVHPYE